MKHLILAAAVILSLFDVSAKSLPELDAELVKLIEENKQTEIQNFFKTKKVSIDAKSAALRLAVEKNRVKMACMLIRDGANPRIKDENGITSLMIAAIKNYPSMAGMLMKMNGDSKIKDNKGDTALIHSIRKNNMEVFNVLYNFKPSESWCKEVIGEALFIALKLDRIEMAKILIERLTLIKQIFRNNINEIKEISEIQGKALHIALKSGHIKMAKLLIEQDANLEYSSYQDETPLMLASTRGYTDIVKLLIEKGANVNAKRDGNTPLAEACKKGYIDIAKLLIGKGAEVNDSRYGSQSLISACENGNFDIAKLLLEKGADANSSRLHGKYKKYESVMVLANNKHRSEEDCIKLMKLLLKYGADINARDSKYNQTVLMLALQEKHSAIAKFLLKNGADIFTKDGRGHSAIFYLIAYTFEKVINFVKKKIG